MVLGWVLWGLAGQLSAQSSAYVNNNYANNNHANSNHANTNAVGHAVSHLATTRLLELLLNAHMPKILHQEKNIPWMGGKRSLIITKAGAAKLTSTATVINIQVPLNVVLSGNINTSMVLVQINAACTANFITPAAIALFINFNKKPLDVVAKVEVTVPPVMADCQGYQLSVQALISAVIEQQKVQWQKNIQQQITDALKDMDL